VNATAAKTNAPDTNSRVQTRERYVAKDGWVIVVES
jgi:hypothetical protein